MIVIDDDLINRVRSVAGRNIHDTESSIGLYKNTLRNYNKWIASDRLGLCERQLYIHKKHERILRSFLVTNDIKESRKLIEIDLGEDYET